MRRRNKPAKAQGGAARKQEDEACRGEEEEKPRQAFVYVLLEIGHFHAVTGEAARRRGPRAVEVGAAGVGTRERDFVETPEEYFDQDGSGGELHQGMSEAVRHAQYTHWIGMNSSMAGSRPLTNILLRAALRAVSDQ